MRRCRICKSFRLKKVFSLGKQPLANQFTESPEQKKYPLDLYQCQHCTLLQLGYVVPKEVMYDEYFYVPSVSTTQLEHFNKLADELIGTLNLEKSSLVVDVGGNDGSLLKCFKERNMDVLNVEPAKNIDVLKGIRTLRSYFTPLIAKAIVKFYGKAKLVTATNSFAHIDDLHEYLKALDILLDEDGVFFAQFPDARNLLRENQFDTIYHEHLSYFTYESLHHLFANSPFELFNITSDNIHGGSMRIWVRRRPKLLEDFTLNSDLIINRLSDIVSQYQSEGKKVVGFGAAAKGTVLLNATDLNLNYVVDGTSYKQGKLIPGVNTPIYPEEHLLKDPPDVVVILAWNFKDEIMKKLAGRGYTFIVPIPKVEVIGGENGSTV